MEDRMIDYYSFESVAARFDRTNKRLMIVLIISIIILFLSNMAWLYAWMQYDYTSERIEIDSHEGTANYIGRDGDITNGNN